jgi:cation transport ATPase
MLSGDRRSVATRIGRALGVDRIYAGQIPEASWRSSAACSPTPG